MLAAHGPAIAGTTLTGDYASVTLTGATGFVILDGGFHATGSVTNSGSIGPGNADGIAFLVEAGAEIDGLLANTSLASITAVDSVSNANATATAVHINGAVNTVSNAGTISAASNSLVNTGGQFTVAAHGVAHNGDAAVTPEVSLVNDGGVSPAN
jgi:hypothetical protein